jgi:hypothetical protein
MKRYVGEVAELIVGVPVLIVLIAAQMIATLFQVDRTGG